MEMPPTMLYNYLREKMHLMKTGVVIADGRLYPLCQNGNGHKNHFKWHNSTFGLNDGPYLAELERSYISKNLPSIDRSIKLSLESMLGEKERKLIEKQGSIFSLDENISFAKKVIDEIIPNFDMDHCRIKNRRRRRAGHSFKRTAIEGAMGKDKYSIASSNDINSLIMDVSVINNLLRGDLFLINGNRYGLRRTDFPAKKNYFICFNNRIYDIEDGSAFDLAEFDKQYRNSIAEQINSFVLNKNSAFMKQMERITKMEKSLELLGRSEYIDPGKKVGFKVTHGKFHVCMLVDRSYIFYDPFNEKYYGFGPEFGKDSALVGVPLSNCGSMVNIGKPVVINKLKHPSLQGHEEYQDICTGEYENKGLRPKQCTREQMAGTVLGILYNILEIFTEGYSGLTEWKKLHSNEEYFKSYLIRPEHVDHSKVSNMFLIGEIKTA